MKGDVEILIEEGVNQLTERYSINKFMEEDFTAHGIRVTLTGP